MHLSLAAVHRRGWGSLYAALSKGRLDEEGLQELLADVLGDVCVRAWSGLHPKTRRAAGRYGSESATVAVGTVVLVEVGRLQRGERRRSPRALWLWWHGEGDPDLDLLWRSYCRRFDVEHFVKFLKGTLGWTAPRVRHPEQANRWTWLVLLAYAQLVLARAVAEDRRLPWERPLPRGS